LAENKLTDKQKRFCEEYLIDLNATQAAIRSGYAEKDADVQGPRLLGNVGIQAEIKRLQDARSQRTEKSADDVLREYEAIGFSDIRHYFDVDDEGIITVRSFEDIPSEYTRIIESIKQTRSDRFNKDGDLVATQVKTELKLWDKHKALEMVARHVGGFEEIKKLDVDMTVTEQVIVKLHEIEKAERLKTLDGSKNRIKDLIEN